jgi:hypothetical protein
VDLGPSHNFSQNFPKQLAQCDSSVEAFTSSLRQAEVGELWEDMRANEYL